MPEFSESRELEKLEKWRKKRRALELRLARWSYEAIAEELGINCSTAWHWVREMSIVSLPQEEMEQLRAMEAANIDESEKRLLGLINMIAGQAARRLEADELANIEPVVKRIESLENTLVNVRKRRAQMLGYDQPSRIMHNVAIKTQFDAEMEALVQELVGGGNLLSSPELLDMPDV